MHVDVFQDGRNYLVVRRQVVVGVRNMAYWRNEVVAEQTKGSVTAVRDLSNPPLTFVIWNIMEQ